MLGQCPVSGSGQSKRLPCLCIFGFLKYRPLKFLACCIACRKSTCCVSEYPVQLRYLDIQNIQYRHSDIETRSTVCSAGLEAVPQISLPCCTFFSLLYHAFISLLSRLNTTLHCPSSYPLLPFSNMDTLLAKRDTLRARRLNPPGPSSFLERLRAPSRRQYIDQRNLWES